MLKRSQYLGPSCGIAPGNSAGKVVCAVQCQSRSIWQPSLGDLVAPGHDSLAEFHALPEQRYICYLLGLGLALWRPRPLPIKRSRVGPPFAECAPGQPYGRAFCRSKVYLLPARARARALMAAATVPPATAFFCTVTALRGSSKKFAMLKRSLYFGPSRGIAPGDGAGKVKLFRWGIGMPFCGKF